LITQNQNKITAHSIGAFKRYRDFRKSVFEMPNDLFPWNLRRFYKF